MLEAPTVPLLSKVKKYQELKRLLPMGEEKEVSCVVYTTWRALFFEFFYECESE